MGLEGRGAVAACQASHLMAAYTVHVVDQLLGRAVMAVSGWLRPQWLHWGAVRGVTTRVIWVSRVVVGQPSLCFVRMSKRYWNVGVGRLSGWSASVEPATCRSPAAHMAVTIASVCLRSVGTLARYHTGTGFDILQLLC
jgi:hypothetical protein